MRKASCCVFLVAGVLLGLVFLDELFFHVTSGDAAQYEYMVVSSVGSVACFAAALVDWRPIRRADNGDHRLRDIHKPKAVVIALVGTLLALVAAFGYSSAPWPAHELMFAFPVVFGLAAVACFRAALADGRTQPVEVGRSLGRR